MKKNYSKFLFITMIAFGLKANAQCSSCTTTISTADAASHIVSSGQTLCITATGSASGLITVATGGTLCNQGAITSTNIWVAGGTLNNYGTITTGKVLVSVQGVFNNYHNANIDSLLVTNMLSSFLNTGSITDNRLAFSDNATGTNNGNVTVNFLGDSTATYTNNINTTIDSDLYNAYNSGCFNHGYMKVSRDFYNSTGSDFETDCMIDIGRDWYNSALIIGPAASCGGFNIVAVSANSGTIGSSSTHIDICDAGHPALGLDGPGGTIASTTTYCTCTNECAVMAGIADLKPQSTVLIQNLYPNPATTNLTIELNDKTAEQLQVEVMDMMGRKCLSDVFRSMVGSTRSTIDISKLSQGTYILRVTDSKQLQTKQLFNVAK